MSSYLRFYKNDNFQSTFQTYEKLEDAKRDKLLLGGHIVRELGVVDDV